MRFFCLRSMQQMSEDKHGLESVSAWTETKLHIRYLIVLLTPLRHVYSQNIHIQTMKSSLVLPGRGDLRLFGSMCLLFLNSCREWFHGPRSLSFVNMEAERKEKEKKKYVGSETTPCID